MKDRIIGEGQLNRDAIETHKKCGLLPSELLQQRDEWKATAEINDRAHDKAVNELMEVKNQRDELLDALSRTAKKLHEMHNKWNQTEPIQMPDEFDILGEAYETIKNVKETL